MLSRKMVWCEKASFISSCCSPFVHCSRLDLFQCLCALIPIERGAMVCVLVVTLSIAWYSTNYRSSHQSIGRRPTTNTII
jgi:hypothetical protein